MEITVEFEMRVQLPDGITEDLARAQSLSARMWKSAAEIDRRPVAVGDLGHFADLVECFEGFASIIRRARAVSEGRKE